MSLSNTQSLTGEARIQSLNSIYNRVTLLKSKNYSRKLVQVQNDQSTSFLANNYQSPFNHFQTQQTANFPNNFISTKRLTKLSYGDDDKQSDNIETNFWPSENIIQQSRMMKMIGKQPNLPVNIPSGQGRRRLLSTNSAANKISKTVSVRGENNQLPRYSNSINSNKIYLMSEYAKKTLNHENVASQQQHSKKPLSIPKQQKQQKVRPFSTNKLTKPNSSTLSTSLQKSKNLNHRPLTSGIRRQNNRVSTSFRVSSQVDRSKRSLLSKTVVNTYGKGGQQHTNGSINKDHEKSKTIINSNNNTLSRKSLNNSRVSLIKGQTRYNTYKQQINKFQQLYQCLSQVLVSIKQGLSQVERAVSMYSNFIQSNKLTFIDDFIQDRQPRLQKLVKTTRLQQTLSICYLFLEIAQERIYDNESYLVNFIGHSLSNLLLVLRLYMIKQRREEFQISDFQSALEQMQKVSYGQSLTSQTDILLRIQHNSEILTMIHKKLGRNNEKFQSCIVRFLKVAQREKYSCSLSAHYIFQFLAMHIHQLEMVGVSPTLQLAPKPYAAPSKKQYTLVIQPLGILQKDGTYRPYVNQFMRWACKNFDVVLWTWQQTLQVQQIFTDLSQFVTTKLNRHHCKIQNNIFVKDLSRLGRDLTKTLIIDFDKRIFAGFEGNGIECRWRGNKGDKSLLVLSQILQEMITSQTSVQDTLTFYAQEIFNVRGY